MLKGRISFPDWCEQNGYETLLRQWDYESNQFGPEDIGPRSRRLCWWRCEKVPEHSWRATLNSRTSQKGGCPYCGHRLASPEYNLATEFPFVAEEWLYEKNDGPPTGYLPHSEKEAYWRCRYHPDIEWKSKICSRTSSRISNCPACQKERGTSFPEQVVYYYLKLLFNDAENRTQIGGAEADIYLPSLIWSLNTTAIITTTKRAGRKRRAKRTGLSGKPA